MDDLLDSLRVQCAGLDQETFASRYAGWYLLGNLPSVDAPGEDGIRFNTEVVALPQWETDADGNFVPAAPAQPVVQRTRFLLKVVKSDRNTWRRRISVGRARNNDLVIRHDLVSKLHAHFHVNAGNQRGSAADAEFLLSDVGSANGTSVNGARLEPDAPVPVHSRDKIVFADVECALYDSFHLFDALRGL